MSKEARWVAALAVFAAVILLGRKKTMSKPMAFVGKFKSPAVRVGSEYGLPPWLILTQAAHESGYGVSALTTKAMNLFGFTGEAWEKAGKPVYKVPTREFLKGVWVVVTRPFRAYTTYEDSMRDYARLLTTSPRYALTVAAARKGDVAGTFDALGKSGYATDPTYGAKLKGVYASLKEALV